MMKRIDLNEEDVKDLFDEWKVDESEIGEDDLDKLEVEMDAIIQAKTDLKSKAGIMWKRAGNGILAWIWINAWYLETTGMGISQRRGRIMCPPRSKKDEDVIYDVEVWIDEMRELEALGQEELGPGYKITALKMIVTERILKELEGEERKATREQKGQDETWIDLLNLALNV